MALTVTTALTGTIGSATLPAYTSTKASFTPATGVNIIAATQSIGFAADEAIVVGDITGHRALEVFNLDPTNFVSLSTATGGSFAASVFCKILPLQSALFHPTGTIYAKADTAACLVEVRGAELS